VVVTAGSRSERESGWDGRMCTYEGEASSAGDRLDFQVAERSTDDGLHLPSEESHTLRWDGPFLLQHLRQCYPQL
jgi:hypothetical protein